MFLHRAFFWLISATNGTAHLKAEKMERLPLVSHKLEFLQGEVDLFPSADASASIKRHSNHCWLKGGEKNAPKKFLPKTFQNQFSIQNWKAGL
jgi:hypothetical protein